MEAIKMKKSAVVGLQGGGSKDVHPGDVLFVGKGQELSEDDGRYMVGMKKADECERSERKKKTDAAKA